MDHVRDQRVLELLLLLRLRPGLRGEGARYGAIIGLFFGISQSYDSYVIYPIPYSLALKWFLSGLAVCVVLGIVAAAVYKPAKA